MRRFTSRRPSPALVLSLIALFVSLGGVSYGLATGSINSREIRDNSVRGKDIRNRTLTNKDLGRRELDGTNIKIERVGGDAVKEQVLEAGKIGKVPAAVGADLTGGLTAEQIIERARGNTGPAGPRGDSGTQGPAGPQGPPGEPGAFASAVVRRGTEVAIPADSSRDLPLAECQAGETAVGGGADTAGAGGSYFSSSYLLETHPVPTSGPATAWRATYRNSAPTPASQARAYVICVR